MFRWFLRPRSKNLSHLQLESSAAACISCTVESISYTQTLISGVLESSKRLVGGGLPVIFRDIVE